MKSRIKVFILVFISTTSYANERVLECNGTYNSSRINHPDGPKPERQSFVSDYLLIGEKYIIQPVNNNDEPNIKIPLCETTKLQYVYADNCAVSKNTNTFINDWITQQDPSMKSAFDKKWLIKDGFHYLNISIITIDRLTLDVHSEFYTPFTHSVLKENKVENTNFFLKGWADEKCHFKIPRI